MTFARGTYAPLASEPEKELNDDLDTLSHPKQGHGIRISVLLAAASLVGTYLSGVATSLVLTRTSGRLGSQQVRPHDYLPAAEAVELETVHFIHAPWFDDQGEPYFHQQGEHKPKYFGKGDADEVDRAWSELLSHRYFLISDDEALQAWGRDYRKYYKYPGDNETEAGYVAGLDVFHELHCLDHIRKVVNPERYTSMMSETYQSYHTDHCIDLIRQSLQCHSDITLIPSRWWPALGGTGRNFVDTDQPHTCRNFDEIRRWAHGRWSQWHRATNQHLPPVEEAALHMEDVEAYSQT